MLPLVSEPSMPGPETVDGMMDEADWNEQVQVIRCVADLVDNIAGGGDGDADISGWSGLAMYTSGGRRRAVNRHTAEEQVLDRIARDVRSLPYSSSLVNSVIPG